MIQRYKTCAVSENGIALINAIQKDENGPLVHFCDYKKEVDELNAELDALKSGIIDLAKIVSKASTEKIYLELLKEWSATDTGQIRMVDNPGHKPTGKRREPCDTEQRAWDKMKLDEMTAISKTSNKE